VRAGHAADAGDDAASTRDRLLAAAVEIVTTQGTAALTTVEVCRRVGIAQSSYYSHFASRDDLLVALAEVVATHTALPNHEARGRHATARDGTTHREMFRVPLEMISTGPELFRLTAMARAAPPDTELGARARRLDEAERAAVADLLMELGGVDDPALRRRHEMVADCITAMIAALGAGHVEGRYPDLEELVDVLVLLTRWGTPMSRWLTAPSDAAEGTTSD
jgi:AcrR family transcriptional regulator